jgi:predicted nucleotidyltransferase
MALTIDSKAADYRAKLRNHLADIADRDHVASLALFGSRVRGEGRIKSDLDVLAHIDDRENLDEIALQSVDDLIRKRPD